MHCVRELVCLTSGVRASVTRVADVWAILGLPPQMGGTSFWTRARVTEEEGGTEGDGVRTVVTGAVRQAGEGRELA